MAESTTSSSRSKSESSPPRANHRHPSDEKTRERAGIVPGDVEKAAGGDQEERDSNLVDWSENDPACPKNWSTTKKWGNLGAISLFRVLTPLASSMIAPVTSLVLNEFHTTNETFGSFVVSIYILGYALGPLALAPLSEIYGRLPVYHVSNFLFVFWNVGCALSPNIGALLAFRLLAGIVGSCPVTLGNGTIGDCVPKEQRGRATAIFSVGPLLGPVVGPIAGGFLGSAAGWRWIFWLVTIASGACALISLLLQDETYEPVLLERRTKQARQESNNPDLYHRHSHNLDLNKREIFRRAISRPLAMLFTSPIVTLTSIYVGLVYGYTYLLFTSFESLFQSIYNFSQSTIGLTYLGFGIGCLTGLITFGAVSDRMVAHFSKGSEWKPEYRLLPLLPGSLVVPIGLLWYGWSAEEATFWIVPIIGTAWIGLGMLCVFMPVQSYLIDAFPLYAASAAAANTIFRSLLGAFLPLAGPSLYKALGQGWGNTLLAFVALAFTPMAWIVFRYGGTIRKQYPGRVR